MKMASLWKHRLLASFWEAPPLAFSLLHKNPLADRREYTSKQFVLPQCEPPCLAVSLHPDRRQNREWQSWGSTVAAPPPPPRCCLNGLLGNFSLFLEVPNLQRTFVPFPSLLPLTIMSVWNLLLLSRVLLYLLGSYSTAHQSPSWRLGCPDISNENH